MKFKKIEDVAPGMRFRDKIANGYMVVKSTNSGKIDIDYYTDNNLDFNTRISLMTLNDRFSFEPKPLDVAMQKLAKPANSCSHVWKSDSFFSAKIYNTCTKCGAKQEEL